MSDSVQQAAIKELMKESPRVREYFMEHGTDYMAMPGWLRERLTEKVKAVSSQWSQMEMDAIVTYRSHNPHV